MLELSTEIRPSLDVVACELDGGAALLDLKSGDYFRLNETGSMVWNDIAVPKTFSELIKGFVSRFGVDEAVLERDLKAVLSDLIEKGLVVTDPV